MKTVSTSYFKEYTSKILVQISKTKEGVIITKRGEPIAEVLPVRKRKNILQPGKLAETLVFEKDIVSPLGDMHWNACK